MKFTLLLTAIVILLSHSVEAVAYCDRDQVCNQMIEVLVSSGIHPSDLALIESNIEHLTTDHVTEIMRFMMNTQAFADARWFDVSQYSTWDAYNFERPVGDTTLTILARRDLFLDAARQVNNPALTNMSDEALAALSFAQAYVEEKWDQQPPWEGEPENSTFNWAHPEVLQPANIQRYTVGSELERLRVEFWWATYFSGPVSIAHQFGFGKGSDFTESLRGMRPPESNAPRLAGYAFPVGNQLYLQTAETLYWYAAYLERGAERYGAFEPPRLETQIQLPAPLTDDEIVLSDASGRALYPHQSMQSGLWALYTAPFARELRLELTHPETAAFWNTMRLVWAGARQREGGSTPENPQDGQPSLFAIRYDIRSPSPNGRHREDVSAFSLLTTVYSDSILLDFTNWDTARGALNLNSTEANRPDAIHRMVSERNKAIFVIEQMGNEALYPNATHISGSRGLGLNLITMYENPSAGDFLPYESEEVRFLTAALVADARDYQLEASRQTLCNSPLLKSGYVHFASRTSSSAVTWEELVGNLCG